MIKNLKNLNLDKKTLLNFIIIAIGSQLIYSLNALRSVLYNPFREALGVTNTQFGFLLSLIGIVSTIAYIPGGWLQNRFTNRKLLSVNMLITGLCGYYFVFAPQYKGLLLIFALFGLTQEAFYWAAVLKSVRCVAPENKQGTAFGALELVRGTTEFATNALGIFIFTAFGQAVFGMKVAMAVHSTLIVIMAIVTWIFLPEIDYLKANTSTEKNKLAFKGLIKCLAMPEVWFVGIVASGIYATYQGLQYFLPFLQGVYGLPVAYAAIFGLFNTSGTRMVSSPLGGVIGDKKFGGATKLMRVLLVVVMALVGILIFIPKNSKFMIPSMVILILISISCYMLRGVYYAPIGELRIPKEISGSAMSVAAFIGYSPMFWAPATYGHMMDKYEPAIAFNKIFMIMLTFSAIGFVFCMMLSKMIDKKKKAFAEAE